MALSTATIIWLVTAVVLIIIEACSTNMVTIWVAIGAIFAAIAASFCVPAIAQWGIFVLVSGLLLIATRPLAKKFVPKTIPLNYDRTIGEIGLVIEEIDPVSGKGQVKVMGQIWSAKSADNSVISADTSVEVVEVVGAKVVVKQIEN